MPDPSQTAGGSPDEWGGNGGSQKSGCDSIFALILLIGLGSLAGVVGSVHFISTVLL